MQFIEVKSREDFEFWSNEILSEYENEKLVFRGQTRDRPLVPSMRRGEGNLPSPGCIPSLTGNWNVCANRLVSKLRATPPTDIEIQGVMQHYGYRSFFVDVTSDRKIALWFALHEFTSEKAPFHVDEELRSAVFQWAKYSSTPTGFMYSIVIPNENSNEYLDLVDVMPESATRVWKQQAGAIFCSPGARSVDSLVVAKMQIVDNGWFRESSQNAKTTELFPPPSSDLFYRCLCTVPYFIAPEAEAKKINVGHPLLGFFPIYAESAKELFKEYVPLTRILTCAHPALEWNVVTEVIDLENLRFKTAGATRILLSSLMVERVSETLKTNEIVLGSFWPSRNLVLEFEPEASLVSPSPKPVQEVVRGLWVVIGTKSMLVAEIIDTFNNVSINHRRIYSLPELNLTSTECNCTDHSYDLDLLKKISHLLAQGTVHFEKDVSGYLRLEYTDKS